MYRDGAGAFPGNPVNLRVVYPNKRKYNKPMENSNSNDRTAISTLDGGSIKPITNFGVLGAGAWGTALAVIAAQPIAHRPKPGTNRSVVMWAHEAETVEAINQDHENKTFLDGVRLPASIVATTDLEKLAQSDAILMVVPAQFARTVLAKIAPLTPSTTPIILCSKGIEQNSLKLMSDVAAEYFSAAQIAVLSGPSFAADVSRGLPTAVTLACENDALATAISTAIGQPFFRPYISDDIIGTERGGAIKNVIAIACGIVDGKQLGQSARAAITARGFSELGRLGQAMGGRMETMSGLSGLGDLILTAGSRTSRNFSFGVALGEGQSASDIFNARSSVSEGAMSAAAVASLAKKHNLELPICEAVDQIINHGLPVNDAIDQLISRPFTHEI